MRQEILTGVAASLLCLAAITRVDVTVVDSRYSAVLRSTTVQPFPLEIGPGGAVYTVTGTGVNNDLVRINSDGSIQVLNSSVGRVVGVGADLEFGFGGDLFANMGTDVIATPDGVVRFNFITGASSDFYVNEVDYGDGGLAFDASRQRLFMTNEERDGIVSIDSAGNGIVIAPSVGANPWGMAQQSTGRLIVLDRVTGELTAVDPDTGVTSTLAQLGLQLPNHQFVAVDVDKSTDQIYFIGAFSSPTPFAALYALSPDGTDLHAVATDPGLLGLKVGPSSAAGGGVSVYLGNPQNSQITELRIIPEPNMFAPILAVAILIPRKQRKRGKSVRVQSGMGS